MSKEISRFKNRPVRSFKIMLGAMIAVLLAMTTVTAAQAATPVFTSITPAVGTTLGGTSVTISGSGFSAPTVTIGGVACAVTSNGTSVNTIVCTTGAHIAGTVNVVITNTNGGNNSVTAPNAYAYAALASGKAITDFAFPAVGPLGVVGTVDGVNHRVAVYVPYLTNVTALVATFALSASATAAIGATNQVSGTTANNFTAPVTYRVTAQDGTFQDWVVTVTAALNSANDITAFSFATPAATGTLNDVTHTVVVTVPYGTDVHALAATFTLSAGASATVATVAQVSGTTANDFRTDVSYLITAADSTTQIWVVSVGIAPNGDESILTFTIGTPAVTGVVNGVNHTVRALIPYGTSLTNLVATFTLSTGATATIAAVPQVSGTTANNFSSTLTYRVLAQDQVTTQDWLVTVATAPNSDSDFLTYGFTAPSSSGLVNPVIHTVVLNVPYGTSVTALAPTFTLSPDASVTVGGVAQVSGVTAHDFTNPVVYLITAQDLSTQLWTVTVGIGANSEEAITSFGFSSPASVGVVNAGAQTVELTVPYGTNLTALVPTFALVNGGSVLLGLVNQVSGVTANNFSTPVIYSVVAADGVTTKYWLVTVTVGANPNPPSLSSNTSSSITVNGVVVTNGNSVNVPAGTTSVLVAVSTYGRGSSYSITGATGLKVGENIVTVRVVAEDGTTFVSTIHIVVAAPTHTVSYFLGSDVTGAVPTQGPVIQGTDFVVASGSGLAKVGYTFEGWNDGQKVYAGESSYSITNADVVLTAVWVGVVVPEPTSKSVAARFFAGTTFIKPINVNSLQAFVKQIKGKTDLVIEIVGIATSSHPRSTDKQLATSRVKTMVEMLKQLHVVAKYVTSIKVAGTSPSATLVASWTL